MKLKLDIEYYRGHSLYISLWRGGAIWIERLERSWSFEIAKEDGEWFLWFRRLYVIFSPPGLKVVRKEYPAV